MAVFQFVLWMLFVLNVAMTVVYAQEKDSLGWLHLLLAVLMAYAIVGG